MDESSELPDDYEDIYVICNLTKDQYASLPRNPANDPKVTIQCNSELFKDQLSISVEKLGKENQELDQLTLLGAISDYKMSTDIILQYQPPNWPILQLNDNDAAAAAAKNEKINKNLGIDEKSSFLMQEHGFSLVGISKTELNPVIFN